MPLQQVMMMMMRTMMMMKCQFHCRGNMSYDDISIKAMVFKESVERCKDLLVPPNIRKTIKS